MVYLFSMQQVWVEGLPCVGHGSGHQAPYLVVTHGRRCPQGAQLPTRG